MTLKTVDYDENQHKVYAAGRAMPEATRARWMRILAEQLPAARPLTIVDLGSGIGRLTPALAQTFGGPVFGVEPSRKMREIAKATADSPGVDYLAGDAAKMPLADDTADAILMFLSFHHVTDRPAAAVEIARVLKTGGRLLIHTGLSDLMTSPAGWHRFFPRALEIEREMFPSTTGLTTLFEAVGLNPVALVETPVEFWPSVTDAAKQLRLRPFSTFEQMTEDEIAEGFAQLDAAVAAETTPTPITGVSRLMVFG